jgi:hypothetical protein
MGPYANICGLQSWGSGLLCYLLCALPSNRSETLKVCCIVSDDVLFLIFCGYAFNTFGTLRLLSETSHPLGKPAPMQLPVEPAVSYTGEEHSFNERGRALLFTAQPFAFRFFLLSLSPKYDSFKANFRRYDIRWSMGSLLFLASWAFMMGPWIYIQHLTSTPRLPFTAAYFGSIGLTLYFSVGVSW